jgi:VWFA-related protein
MMKKTGSFGIAVLVLLSGSTLRGGGQQSERVPPFRSGLDLVEVDVVVHDAQGRLVTDLKPEDVEIRDDGNPRQIDLFTLIDGGRPSPTATSAALSGSRVFPALAPGRLFIVMFDTDHLSPGGFKRTQAAALTLFEKQFQAGDLGGVVTDGQMVNRRLTGNRDELSADVRNATPSGKTSARYFDEREWPRMTEAEAVRIAGGFDQQLTQAVVRRACADQSKLCSAAPAAVGSKATQLATEARASTDQTLRTLVVLLHGLERFQGRKSILLLSDGFLAEESWPSVQEAVGAATRVNARIYALDARGLDRGLPGGDAVAPNSADNDSLARLVAQFDMGSDSTNSLAVDTGGFVVRNTNNFENVVTLIAQEAATYYVIGFRPEPPLDGKFRRLSVKVNRPGVTVRARRGYVASARSTATASPAPPVRASWTTNLPNTTAVLTKSSQAMHVELIGEPPFGGTLIDMIPVAADWIGHTATSPNCTGGEAQWRLHQVAQTILLEQTCSTGESLTGGRGITVILNRPPG